jgi:hypothetical protein
MIEKIFLSGMKMGRAGLWVLAVMLLFGPFSRSFAEGAQVAEENGITEPVPNNYSLLFAPAKPSGVSDLLTISPVNAKGQTGAPGADPSPNRAAGLDLLSQACQTKPTSYLFSLENLRQGTTPYVGLAMIDHSDTGQKGRTFYDQYNTELMVGCNVPGGSVLFGKGMQVQRPGDTSFKLNDDGWRLRFITKF